MPRVYVLTCLFVLCLSAKTTAESLLKNESSPETLFKDLLSASDFSSANMAAKALGDMGQEGLAFLIKGTKPDRAYVRDVCYRVLQESFPDEEQSVEANIRGLRDEDNGWINVRCALFLGEKKVSEALPYLTKAARDEKADPMVRYAAAQSLGQLGVEDIFPMLYEGLGSDAVYTRIYSNKGLKALCGKDLTDFGYEDAKENASIFGSFVAYSGDPIDSAQWRSKRYAIIVDFCKWIKDEKPELFERLISNQKGK